MALKRTFLKGLGLNDEQIEAVIEAHAETVDGFKADVNKYKGDAEKLPGVQKELDELKAAGDGGYKERYEKEHKAFEDYRKEVTTEKTKTAKEKAYRELLKDAGVSEKRIDTVMKVFVHSDVELDESGKIKDADKVTEHVKKEWADFIVQTQTTGAQTPTPPVNGGKFKSKEEILAIKDGAARRQAMLENPSLFGLDAAK